MNLKSVPSLLFKFFLLFMGVWEFFPSFPAGLDVLDKVLTSLILLYFWFKLGTADFIFGKKSRFFNSLILTSFYILSLDTFSHLMGNSFSIFGTSITTEIVSIFSVYAGSFLIFIAALCLTFQKWGERSFVHSFYSVLFKKWDIFSSKKVSWRLIPKFFVSIIVLWFVWQFLFHLITQWFVVSLDKSLLFLSVLFAIKDLEYSRVKALHVLGDIDDKILHTVKSLFSNSKTFFVGIGFVLMFHVLSDISVFFLPYFFNVPFDSFYFDRIGNPALHQSLPFLISSHGVFLPYLFSSIGVFVILAFPILLCFLITYDVDVSYLMQRLWFRLSSIFCFFFALCFVFFPWISMKSISNTGIYGVDFISHTVPEYFFVLFILGFVLLLFLLFNGFLSHISLLLLFFISFIFWGSYVWNFFVSSLNYYLSSAISIPHLSLLFLLFIFLDFLFYICGFIIFTFYIAKFLIKNFESHILNDSVIMLASFLIIFICMIFIYLNMLSLVAISVIVGLIFNFSFFYYLKGRREFRDDFILAVSILIGTFIFVALISGVFNFANIGFVNLFGISLILIVALLLLKFFKLSISFSKKFIKLKFVFLSIILAAVFSLVFYYIGEPSPSLISDVILYILFFTLIVSFAEELFFRFILLRLAEKSFGFIKALFLQAFLFALIHLLDIRSLGFSLVRLLLYFSALLVFGIVAGLLTGRSVSKKSYSGNIVYAIIFHWLTNAFLLF